MINPFELLKFANPLIKEIVEFPLFNDEELGFQCVIYLQDGHPFSGGCHQDKKIARRIAISEALERTTFEAAAKSPILVSELLLDDFPDTSGFAAGFDLDKTKARSFAEGLERWTRSIWWDHKLKMMIHSGNSNIELSEMAKRFCSLFDDSLFLTKSFSIDDLDLMYGLYLGFKGDGVFAGSRVTGRQGDLWTHATLEASRNLKTFNFAKNGKTSFQTQKNIETKILYFGQNGQTVKDSIQNFSNCDWPNPQVLLSKRVPSMLGVYVWRTLFKDYSPFSLEPIDRFVF